MVGLNRSGFVASYPETNQELYGSGLLKKQERSENDEEGSCRDSKVVETDEEELSNCNNSMSQLRSNSSSLFFSNEFHQQQNQMPNFTCSKSMSQNAALQYFQPAAGYRGNNSKGEYSGFTASQWMELEQQALIYKYIRANIPIPSHLLLPIRKAFESVALSGLSAGVLRPSNTLGWGAFHLGFPTNTDSEPGRCRRTDGKKWRCSRDAVADQKYCERHINRGRHRSRKPVEGQQRPARSYSSAAKTAKTAKTATTTAAANNSTSSSQHQLEPSQLTSLNRMCLYKEQSEELHDPTSFTKLSSTSMYWQKPEGNPIPNAEERCPFEETSHNKFGVVSTDTSHNLTQNDLSPFMCLAIQETGETHHPFMQSWSMNQSDMTHMSLSSDFWSPISTSSEKVSVLPLALSHETDFLQTGFGVGDNSPIDWEDSIGGPLVEALQDSQTSPRCVLQKTTFPNMSYSSAGSSPWGNKSSFSS